MASLSNASLEFLNLTSSDIAAFNATKETLANAALLYYPQPDAPTCLMTDASDTAVGTVLQQHVNGMWHPISFFSRKMTPAETCYSTFDRELLAVYLSRRLPISCSHRLQTPHLRSKRPIRSIFTPPIYIDTSITFPSLPPSFDMYMVWTM